MYVCTCASVRLFLLPFLPLPCLYLLDYNNLMVISHIISSLTHPPPPPFHAVFSSFSLSLRPYFSHIHHFSASVHFFFFPLRKKGQHNTEEDSQYSSSVRVFFVVVVYLHDLVPFLFGVRAVTASHAWIFWFWFFFCRVVSAFVICP